MTRLIPILLLAFAMPLVAQQDNGDQDSQAAQAEEAPENQQAEESEREPALQTRVRRSPSGVIIISGSVARGEDEQPEPAQETPEGAQVEGQQEGQEAAEAQEAEGESSEEQTEEGAPGPPRSRIQNVTAYDLSGNKVSVPISESEKNLEGASQTSLMLTNLNGREVAYLSERERVVKESPEERVVERRTQRYDAGGQPTQQELIREETRTLADGTVVTTATTYVEDINGRMEPTERTVSREKKTGDKIHTTVVSEKPSINGGFRAYSREESVETQRGETSVEIRKTRRIDDGSGRLIESAREETVMTKSGNKSITQTVVYEREAMSSKMTLSSRTVGELIERPDGSSSETVQVYGLSPTTGSTRFLNASGPQLMRTITRERTLGTGGEIVETTRTRVRSFADPSRMGGEESQQKVTRPSEDGESIQILRRDNTFHVVHQLTHVRGRHTLKAGLEYRRFSNRGITGFFGRGQFNFLGAFTTNAVADLLLGFPTFTIQTVIDNPFRQRTSSWNGYLQDDWKVTPRLTLNLGLRYEWNRPATDGDDRFTFFDLARNELVRAGADGASRSGYRSDANNIAPRVGVSWSPVGSDDLVVRAGYGVFYDVAILEANSGLYFNPPFFELRVFVPTQQQLLTLSNPFPESSGFAPPPSVNAMQPDFRTAYMQHWNASAEKALPRRVVVRAAYVGSKGTKLLRRRDINQPAPGEGPVQGRRPIPGFANVVVFESGAASTYHSGQLSVERRFGRGFTFSGAYVLSKSIDDMSALLQTNGDQSFAQNNHDLRAERGLSAFARRHRFVLTTSYALPFQRNLLARGWQLYGIGSFQSGPPFTPRLSFDNSNTGNTGDVSGVDRPAVVGNPRQGPSTPERFFNTAAFARPERFRFGNAGRNILTGPGLATVDVAIVRTFALSESVSLDFRTEAFNLANRANFDLPCRVCHANRLHKSCDLPDSDFGSIPSAKSARQIQFSLRLRF